MIFWFKRKTKFRIKDVSDDLILNKIEKVCSYRSRLEIESSLSKFEGKKLSLLVQINNFIDACLASKCENAKISYFLHHIVRSSRYITASQLDAILKILSEMVIKHLKIEPLLLKLSDNAQQVTLLYFEPFLLLAEEMLKKNMDPTITINYLFDLNPQVLQRNSRSIYSLLMKLVEKQIDPKETVWALSLLPTTMSPEDFDTLLSFLMNLADRNENPYGFLTTVTSDPNQAMLYESLRTIDWQKFTLHNAEVKKSGQLLDAIRKKIEHIRHTYAEEDDLIWDKDLEESLHNIRRVSAEDFNKVAPLILELLKNRIYPNDFILLAESLIKIYPEKSLKYQYLNALKEIMLRRKRCGIEKKDAVLNSKRFSKSKNFKESKFQNYFFYKLNQKLWSEPDKFDLHISQFLRDLANAEEETQREIEHKKWLKTVNEKPKDIKAVFEEIESICKSIWMKAYEKDLLDVPITFAHIQRLEENIEHFVQKCTALSNEEFIAMLERLPRTRFWLVVTNIGVILSESDEIEYTLKIAFSFVDIIVLKGCVQEAIDFLETFGVQLFALRDFESAYKVFEKAKSIIGKIDQFYDEEGNDKKKWLFDDFDQLSKASELCSTKGCSLSTLESLVGSENEFTRIVAIKAMCLLYDWDIASSILAKLLKDPSARIRRITIGTIIRFMFKRVEEKSNRFVLFETGFPKKLANAIFSDIDDEDPEVREVVILGLSIVGDLSFASELIRRKYRENTKLQHAIDRAVMCIKKWEQDLREIQEAKRRLREQTISHEQAINYEPRHPFYGDYTMERIKERHQLDALDRGNALRRRF